MTPAVTQDPQAIALYDSIMRVINADLTSDQFAETMKRREDESEADYNDRLEQYAADVFMADQAIAELNADFDMQAFLEKDAKHAEDAGQSAKEDAETIDAIEDQLSGSIQS